MGAANETTTQAQPAAMSRPDRRAAFNVTRLEHESEQVHQTMAATAAFLCLECGKCTAVCPITRFGREASPGADRTSYSPRRVMSRAITGSHERMMADAAMWSCLTCGLCEENCPADVDFTALLQQVRAEALPARKSAPVCNHGGTLHALMRIMATPELKQNRREWLTDDLETSGDSDTLLFVGCLPYYDAYFGPDYGVDMLSIARAAVKILNRVGIQPVVLADERCCGHDLLWNGEEEKFTELMELNVAALAASGAKNIVTTCAECYRTLALDYPKRGGAQPWKVQHISELMADKVAAGELSFEGLDVGVAGGTGTAAPISGAANGTVTFHDPCRLGRHSGKYDEPRRVLDAIPGLSRVEMERSRERAMCCGTSGWNNCALTSKKIQAARLTSAHDSGAGTLVTSCPKCYIHFHCALKDGELAERAAVQVRDLSVVAAEAMKEG